jgi:hypothetical protein
MTFRDLKSAISLSFLCFGLLVSVAIAQVSSGTILGTVLDQSGGGIPRVSVTVTDMGTGFQRTVTTGSDGNYVVENLSPGSYEVAASISGFKAKTTKGILLRVDERARVDMSMEIGDMTQHVTVQAAAATIETDNANIGEVIETKKVLDLPLNGRSFYQLATLTPGVMNNDQDNTGQFAQTGSGTGAGGGGSISSNGMQPASTNVLLDGVQNTEFGAGRLAFSPSIDLIQEFKILGNVYDAEFGQSPSAQISIITKRGTLKYHGSAYGFHRNDNLDARNFFQTDALPEFRRSQFGGSLGGNIPKSKRDFFFLNYEGSRQSKGLTIPLTVPALAIKNGDFSGTTTTIYDPLTLDPATGKRQPFLNNRIPDDRITQQAKVIRELWPDPVLPVAAGNFISNPTRVRNTDQWSIRYDRNFSEKDTITFRYTRNKIDGVEPKPRDQAIGIPGFRENEHFTGQNHRFGWTHIFTPTTLNSFNFGFSQFAQVRDMETSEPGAFSSTGKHGPLAAPTFFERSGIQGINPESAKAGLPWIIVNGFTNIFDDAFAPAVSSEPHIQFSNILSTVSGNHSLKAGFDTLHATFNLDIELLTRGLIIFSPKFTTAGVNMPGDQNNAFADFLLGQIDFSLLFGNALKQQQLMSWWSGFVQDNWSIHPNLTLNLGLRYEIYNRPVEKHNRVVAIDLNSQSFVFPGAIPTLPGTPPNSAVAEDLGYSRSLQANNTYNNFAPRLGFAWRMFGNNKTVLRGGAGMFYSWFVTDMAVNQGIGAPFVPNIAIGSNPDVPAVNFTEPFEGGIAPSTGGSVAIKDNRTPYVLQYSLSVDRAITEGLGAEVAYVGNAARKIMMSFPFNQPFPGPGPVAPRRPFPAFSDLNGLVAWGTAHYDALQVKVRKELGPRGLMLLGSYTWGRALGTAVPGANFRNVDFRDSRNWKADYGPTPWDVKQIFSLSWIYELPFGKGKPLGGGVTGLVDQIVSGWRLGGIANFQSGHPLTVTDIFDTSNAGGSRPNVIRDPNSQDHSSKAALINQYFNTAAFIRAEPFTFGNAGTGIIRGPGQQLWDLSLQKIFSIQEGKRLQFRIEYFNAFNHANFGNPNTLFGSSSFGVITTAKDGREIQFGLRFDF